MASCSLQGSGDGRAPSRSSALTIVEEIGAHVLEDVDRIVQPAIACSQSVAADRRTIAALRSADRGALTRLADATVLESGAVDVVAFFDARGALLAISQVYADGRSVPRERIERVIGRDFASRPIVAGCLRSEGDRSVLEFQTDCDITPAYFDSTGLSIAYSTPVHDTTDGTFIGVVSTRLEFDRLQALLHDGAMAARRQSLHFVTDDGHYFSEDFARGAEPPIPAAELAEIVAPVAAGMVQRSHADVVIAGEDARVTILPMRGVETLDGGGLSLMLIADRSWIDAEIALDALTHRVLWGSTIALALLVVAGIGLLALEHKRRLELKSARDAAQSSERAKSAFLAHMSHEIRTPLTAILGFADEITRCEDMREIREHGATVLRNGQSLLAILDDVLDLSKIEAERATMRLAPASPRALVEETVALFEARSREKGVPIDVDVALDVEPALETDGLRVRQILSNLLGNALKFTTAGRVAIRVRTRALDAILVELDIAVVDTGPGIALEDQRRLFQPFVQAESGTSRRFGGTGLGLTISRRFAGLLGGTLELESVPGAGSTFRLRVPTRRAALPPPALPSPSSTPAPVATPLVGRRVLVVDDGADNRRLLGAILRRAGAEVVEAEDGRSAIDAATAAAANGRAFDIALMDVQMPGMDGLTATRELVARGLGLPIIAVSAGALDDERRACIAAGCSAFVAKPIDRRELLTRMLAAMGRPAPIQAA